MAMIKN